LSSFQQRPPVLGESTAIESLRDFIVGVSLRSIPVLLVGASGVGKRLAASKIQSIGRYPDVHLQEIEASSISLEHAIGAGLDPDNPLVGGNQTTLHITGTELVDRSVAEALERRISCDPDLPRLLFSSRTPIAVWKNLPIGVGALAQMLADHEHTIPPLRERIEDVPHLCRYRIQTLTEPEEFEECWREFSSRLLPGMLAYDWPGNVRELNSVVSRCCAMPVGCCADPARSFAREFEKGLGKFRRSMALEVLQAGSSMRAINGIRWDEGSNRAN